MWVYNSIKSCSFFSINAQSMSAFTKQTLMVVEWNYMADVIHLKHKIGRLLMMMSFEEMGLIPHFFSAYPHFFGAFPKVDSSCWTCALPPPDITKPHVQWTIFWKGFLKLSWNEFAEFRILRRYVNIRNQLAIQWIQRQVSELSKECGSSEQNRKVAVS